MFDDFKSDDEGPTVEIPYLSVLNETPQAWQVMVDVGRVKWLPKSQCQLGERTITVPEWLAAKEGLDDLA